MKSSVSLFSVSIQAPQVPMYVPAVGLVNSWMKSPRFLDCYFCRLGAVPFLKSIELVLLSGCKLMDVE